MELEFVDVGFCGGRKTGEPGEKPSEQGARTNNKLNPHLTPAPGIETGPQQWEASALTTVSSLHPKRGFTWQPCCMAGTMGAYSYGKKCSFYCKTFSLFLSCNMAAVQNLSEVFWGDYTQNAVWLDYSESWDLSLVAFVQTRKLNVQSLTWDMLDVELLKQVAFCEGVHNYIKYRLKLLVND